MKKLFVILTALFLLPLSVYAQDVTDVDADINGNKIEFFGETEDGALAVMCKLYDENDEQIDMLSVAVVDNEFSGEFRIAGEGEYVVGCADYDGGEILSSLVIVDEITAATYMVTFNTKGGSAIDPVEVEDGNKVARPENPTKEGFIFGGWFEDDTCLASFDFNTPITGTTILYAKWNPIPETVTVHTIFFGDGGTYQVDFDPQGVEDQGAMGAPITSSGMYNVPVGEDMTLSATPSEGWHFKGWYTVHEEDTDGQGHMEWVLDQQLSTNTTYTYTPEGTPYIEPVFEEDIIIHVVSFVTNCDELHLDPFEVVEEPNMPQENDGLTFDGWYTDSTLTTAYDFATRVTADFTLYAKWTDNRVSYTVTDDEGNSISFKEEAGHEFEFAIVDLSKLTDEELQALTGGQINKEQYDEALEVLKEAVSDEGTFVAIYEIVVYDENDHYKDRGPFTIRIKKTPEMEAFNSFKLLYVDTDNEFEVLETITMSPSEDGEYLEGTLEHLSSYVLVGNNVEESTNPKTLDNIYIWIIALIVSCMGLTVSRISSRKLAKKRSK